MLRFLSGCFGIGQRHALAGADDRGVVGLAGKDFEHEGPEEVDRQRVVVGVEARLVPALAELVAIVEIGMAGETVAGVAVAAEMMGVIEALEVAVLFHHPGALLAHEGFQDRSGVFVVIVGRVDVADVVQQRAGDPVGVGAVAPGARRRLQRMAEPGDLVARQALVELHQRVEQPLAGLGRIVDLVRGQELVVVAVAILHRGEFDGRHRATPPGPIRLSRGCDAAPAWSG